MGGVTDLESFKKTGLDAQIQYFEEMNQFWVENADFTKTITKQWREIPVGIHDDPDNRVVYHSIETPEGNLSYITAGGRKTTWITAHLIKNDEDTYLIKRYIPVPRLTLDPIEKRYDEIGGQEILRGFVGGDQAGCWQHATCLYNLADLILATVKKPD